MKQIVKKTEAIDDSLDVTSNNNEKKCKDLFKGIIHCKRFGNLLENLSGFSVEDLSSFEKFVMAMYRDTDAASLGVIRALFGKFRIILNQTSSLTY